MRSLRSCTVLEFGAARAPRGYADMDGESRAIKAACEYKALKECLDRNGGKKEKCEKEWEEFQTLCAGNKKLVLQRVKVKWHMCHYVVATQACC